MTEHPGHQVPPLPPGDPLYGVPSAAQLLAAVRQFLEADVRQATSGQTQFLSRVAANVLAVVERQLVAEPLDRAAHRRLLDGIGIDDEVALARAVREGRFDGREAELRSVVTPTVAARLAVSNPRYLPRPE
jgi:hypothetical protein